MASLTLIRGLPGSGKSTLAEKLAQCEHGIAIEADHYFMRDGEYKFDAKKLRYAHDECVQRTRDALIAGMNVYVSNTFTMLWEMDNYYSMALELGIPVQVIICQGNFGSVHDVPDEKLEQMRARFQYELESKN